MPLKYTQTSISQEKVQMYLLMTFYSPDYNNFCLVIILIYIYYTIYILYIHYMWIYVQIYMSIHTHICVSVILIREKKDHQQKTSKERK